MTAILTALFVASATAAPGLYQGPTLASDPAPAAVPGNRFNGGDARIEFEAQPNRFNGGDARIEFEAQPNRFNGGDARIEFEAPTTRRFADGQMRDRLSGAQAQAPARPNVQMDGPRVRAAKQVIGGAPMAQLSATLQVELTEALAPAVAAPACPDADEPHTNAQARAIAAACWDFLDAGPTDYVQVTRVFTSYARGALGGSEVWVRQDEPIHRTVNGVASAYAPDALALFSSTYIAALKGQVELEVQTDPVDGHITRLRMSDPGSQLEVEVQVSVIPIDIGGAFED